MDGTAYRQVIHSDEDLDALMLTLFSLAREGYTVRIMDENYTFSETCAKEVVTYTTKDKNMAIAWAKEKINEGYAVSTTYNPQTGEYTCTAVR